MAFDTIMVFEDRFRNHILPDKLHMLNVSFLVLQMRREFGGCAGNIAYNLKLLGDHGLPDGDGRARLRAVCRVDGPARASRATTCAWCQTSTPARHSSPPIWTTTRSRPSIPARWATRT